jgi:precorrin-2/cobalt-factor-2 C20-methyltransferase
MTARLYIIGTGPGDPELLTLKAAGLLKECPVIISPRGSKQGGSTALDIVRQAVDITGKKVVELHFPMIKIHMGVEPAPEVLAAWRHAAETVLRHLDDGSDVCFPTLGDPAIYSTGYYLYGTLCGIRPDVEVVFIPGVPAMSSCSASLATPICLGDEKVAIIPATFSDDTIKQTLRCFDTVVLMKVHRVLPKITELLRECDLLDHATLVERAGMADEKILDRLDRLGRQPHYYSTIIVRKNMVHAPVLVN